MATASPLHPERMQAPENFDDWSEEHAIQLAEEDGVELDDARWEVVYFLRNHCRDHGTSCTARHILKALSEHFDDRGGKRYLYSLFPHGPVYQASRLAGLPMPPSTLDLSFGSVH
jgi:tRNA 2-thiouridine synthesizing protein E